MHNEQLITKEKEMKSSVDDSIVKGIKEFKLEQEGTFGCFAFRAISYMFSNSFIYGTASKRP